MLHSTRTKRLSYPALAGFLLCACGAPGPQESPKAIDPPADEAKADKKSEDEAPGDANLRAAIADGKLNKTVFDPLASPHKLKINEAAPDFELAALDGPSVKLSALKGKIVVLEWFNPLCPFVRYAHETGPLKSLAAEAKTANPDLVWFAVNSSAPGKQGHGVEANKRGQEKLGIDYPILLDERGEVGQQYGAKSTPQFFIIDKEGKLIYQGALDNAPMGETKGGARVINYVKEALTDIASGRPISTPESIPYGCSVKYAS